MTITEEASPRWWAPAGVVSAGWLTFVVAVCVGFSATGGDWSWPRGAIACAAAVVILAVAVTAGAVIGRRPTGNVAPSTVVALTLSGVAWLLGGLAMAFTLLFTSTFGDCSGTGLGSYDCVNRAGGTLETLATVSALAPTVVVVAVLTIGRRAPAVAWLGPALMFSFYLLAYVLMLPHVGFGVPHRHQF